jgi:hypothetical protein
MHGFHCTVTPSQMVQSYRVEVVPSCYKEPQARASIFHVPLLTARYDSTAMISCRSFFRLQGLSDSGQRRARAERSDLGSHSQPGTERYRKGTPEVNGLCGLTDKVVTQLCSKKTRRVYQTPSRNKMRCVSLLLTSHYWSEQRVVDRWKVGNSRICRLSSSSSPRCF